MIVVAIGVATLAAAVVSRGAVAVRRGAVASAGLVAVAAGFIILGSARIPVAASEAARAQATSVPASPSTPPPSMAAHDHAQATPAMTESRAGIGTPVSEGGLAVTLDATVGQPGPTDLTIVVTDQTGAPVSEARVVVFSEMAGMGRDTEGIVAVEEEPGHYRAENVSLSMAGA
jgi:hypothetical protein